jgi:hypothetical protein
VIETRLPARVTSRLQDYGSRSHDGVWPLGNQAITRADSASAVIKRAARHSQRDAAGVR